MLLMLFACPVLDRLPIPGQLVPKREGKVEAGPGGAAEVCRVLPARPRRRRAASQLGMARRLPRRR